MARGNSPRRRTRGGESIPAWRPVGTRVALGAGALALAAGLATWPAIGAGRFAGLLAALGVLALGSISFALAFRMPQAVTLAVLALGAEYGASLFAKDEDLDLRAPVYAAALVVLAEAAFLVVETRARPAFLARRLAAVAALALAALGLGSLVVSVAALPRIGGVALGAIGAAAAVSTLALLLALARRAG